MVKGKKGLTLTTQIVLATVAAIVLGTIFGPSIKVVGFLGQVWLRLIQMSIIVLVMTSVASAIGNLEGESAGKMSFHTFKYIIGFTILSAALGLALALIFQPGIGIDLGSAGDITGGEIVTGSLIETLVNFVPTNIFQAMTDGSTVQVIVFSLMFGIAAGMYGRKSGRDDVMMFIKDINGVIMEIINMVMKIAPIGIFGLLAPVAGQSGLDLILPMLKFLLTLVIADLIMFLVYFPYTAWRVGVSPLKMPKKFAKMAIMALTTTSGAVCLPTKMEDQVTKFGVSRRVSDFTGPITMSMNSSGAVACYVVAIMFMAQSAGIVMTPVEILTSMLLAIMMVMGTIVVPGGSVVVYTFFATSLGLPVEGIAVLIGIDWFAGSLRTVMNVTIDVLVGMLVSKDMGEFDKDVYNEEKVVEYN